MKFNNSQLHHIYKIIRTQEKVRKAIWTNCYMKQNGLNFKSDHSTDIKQMFMISLRPTRPKTDYAIHKNQYKISKFR